MAGGATPINANGCRHERGVPATPPSRGAAAFETLSPGMTVRPEGAVEAPGEALRGVLRLLRERGLVTMTAAGVGPSLADAIAGEPVRGSWSEHPARDRIVEAAARLGASPEVLVLRLVAGKVTFLHRALWPSLVRIARDPERVAEAVARLTPGAARLHTEVERVGEVRLDTLAREPCWPPERDLARAARELEGALLVHAATVQTPRGRESLLLRSWSLAVPDAVRREAARLSLEAALEALRACGAVRDGAARRHDARRPRTP
jgi:hypothetical protein